MWQVCLLVKYNIKAKSMCVCVTAGEAIDTDIFTMHYIQYVVFVQSYSVILYYKCRDKLYLYLRSKSFWWDTELLSPSCGQIFVKRTLWLDFHFQSCSHLYKTTECNNFIEMLCCQNIRTQSRSTPRNQQCHKHHCYWLQHRLTIFLKL